MRIGMVIQSYFPVQFGGGVHAHALAEGLRARGHTVKIITTNWPGVKSDVVIDETHIRRIGRALLLPSNGSFSYITVARHLGKKIKQICEEERLDLLHIHSPLDPTLPMAACSVTGIKKVGTFHSYIESDHWYKMFPRYLTKRFHRLDGHIAVSQAVIDFLSRYFRADFTIIPNGISLRDFHPHVPKIERLQDGMFNFFFVGRFEPRKGARILLQAFNRVAALRKHCRLVLVGEGLLKHYYVRFVDEIYRDRVWFEGKVSNGHLPPYYASADVCCFPAIQNEAFGIVILEAMACGKPVIASAVRGYGDLVTDHRDGLLVERRDPVQLAAAMVRLMDDAALRERLSANALAKAQNYDWSRIVDQVEAVYRQILNPHEHPNQKSSQEPNRARDLARAR